MDHFLVDYENIGEAGLKGVESLGSDTSTVIFYSEHADKISFDMHQVLCRCHTHLEFRKAETGKKNALDFQLSTYLGFLVASRPGDRFFIISKDNGYRVVMDFWNKNNIQQIDYIGRAYENASSPEAKPEEESEVKAAAKPEGRPMANPEARPKAADRRAPEKLQTMEKPVSDDQVRNKTNSMMKETLQIKEDPKEASEEEAKETISPEAETPPAPEKRQYRGGRRKRSNPNEPAVDEFKPSQELMDQLSQLIESEEEREDIGRFIVKYKTKQGVNNAIVKKYGTEKAGELYKKIKPLLKDKKGK